MPYAPKRFCRTPRCPNLVTGGGYCPAHQRAKRQVERRHFTGTPGVNYGRAWGKLRAAFLSRPEHLWCPDCLAEGKRVLATELDHVQPHCGDPGLFWDEANLVGRCKSHHSAKTAREVGFGRR